jgi:hypothetical protein
MSIKKWIPAAIIATAFAACNNDSASNNTTDSASASHTTVIDHKTVVEVPAATRTHFETKYPKASNVTWTHYYPATLPIDWDLAGWPAMDTSDYVANFNMDGSDYWTWYDASGDWIGTVTPVDNSGLPAPVSATVKSQFAGYTIKSIDKENDKNRTAYEIQLENGNDKMKALIDENGKLMKKKGKVGGEKIKEKPVKDSL